MENIVVLHVNGAKYEVENPSADLTLADYLRNSLHLTGTKIACGSSGCGSCTVILSRNGNEYQVKHYSVYACGVKIWTLHGCHVTTIEGLGSPTDDLIHPIQEALYKNHGIQCGFCSPGMVMSMQAHQASSKEQDIEDVSQCLQGNLCRCTGYRPILEAFQKLNENGSQVPFQVSIPKESDENLLVLNTNWFVPKNLAEVKKLMTFYNGKYEFVQGGTGNYQIKKSDGKVTTPKFHIYLGLVSSIQKIVVENEQVIFGSGVRLSDVHACLKNVSFSEPFAKALETLGSPQIRNLATIGGSIQWNHPSSDLWPLYLVYGCKILIQEVDCVDTKFIEITEFPSDFKGLILELVIPKPKTGYFGMFKKKARRKEFDLAILNMAALVKMSDDKNDDTIEDIKISFGGTSQLLTYQEGARKTTMAESTMKYLLNKNVKDVSYDDIKAAINTDLEDDNGKLRQSIAFSFIKSLLSKEASGVSSKQRSTSSQVYQGAHPDQSANDLVHRPIPHLWGADLACGKATFIDDIKKHVDEHDIVLIRSEKAHAKIVKLDLSEALKVRGILGCITALDVPGDRNMWALHDEDCGGLMISDEEIFASETVQYHGQVIGALVCQSKDIGKNALKKVVIEYEDLPFVLSLKHAQETLNQNLDDLEVLFNEAIVKRCQKPIPDSSQENIIEISGRLRLGGAEHFYMEPHSAIAIPGEKDELTVHFSTQEVTPTQKRIAQALGLPFHKIIVKNKRAGGAFGGKERMHLALIASVAANKFKKPVRLILNRSEDMSITGHRHESVVEYQVSADKATGKICHAKFKAYANAGSSTDLSFTWVLTLLQRLDGGYTLENFEGVGRAVKTNSCSNTAFRGFGGPEGAFFIETIMDRISHELNLSPLKVREVNLTKEDDLLHHSASRMKGCTLQDCWKVCLEKSRYEEKAKLNEIFNSKNKEVKRGQAIVPIKFFSGMGTKSNMKASALVRVYQDGSVLLTHGGIEMGQGLHTKMIQVASKTLDIDPALIHINEVSTETLANTCPTGGSCGSDLNGPAVMDACQQVMERLKPYRTPEQTWKDCVEAAINDRVCLTIVGHYDKSPLNYDPVNETGDIFPGYLTYGVCAIQVEVNGLTGQVDVLSADLVMDLGHSLNPGIDVGQIEGAFVQGMGMVTTEQLISDTKTGKLITDGPSHYQIPTVADVPKQMNVTLINNSEPGRHSAIYSSKGVGEPPICASAAVVLAIKEAIMFYRRDNFGWKNWFSLEPPCTPNKICQMANNQTQNQLVDPILSNGIEM